MRKALNNVTKQSQPYPLCIIPGEKKSSGNLYLKIIFKGICFESHNLLSYFCLTQRYLNMSIKLKTLFVKLTTHRRCQ